MRIASRPTFPSSAAAFLEPLSCVVHSLSLLTLQAGQSVLVMGDGGFGLLHAMLAAQAGARAMVVGRRDERSVLARDRGLTYIDLRRGNVRAQVLAETQGRGADALIECTGQPEIWERAPDLVRRGGVVSFFGGLPSGTDVTFSAARMHYDEVRLVSPFHFRPGSVRRAYDLLANGAIDPLALVTDTVPLAEIERAFTRLDGGEGIKFAIVP